MNRPSLGVRVLWAVCAAFLVTGASGSLGEHTTAYAASVLPVELFAAPAALASASFEGSGSPALEPQGQIESSVGQSLDTPLLTRLRSLVGLFALGFIAWLMSFNRKMISWRLVAWGTGLQLIFGLFILKTPMGTAIFAGLNTVVLALLGFTVEGARFIFGNLVSNTVPIGTLDGTGGFVAVPGQVANTGALFAFNVLPTIIFFSSLMTVLYHLGIMQWVVKGLAWVMQRTMGTSGAETLSAAGNIFVGQTEAPLLIKPFIEDMTKSELMAVMTGGFATVAGGVMAAYVGMLIAFFPDVAGHLLAASVMSAPAALVVAKLMHPEEEEAVTANTLAIDVERPDVNVIDAASRGAGEGLHLALNVGAMLLAFIALVAMLDGILGVMGGWVGVDGLSIQGILGWGLAPVAWLMGVEWADARTVGALFGIKTALNEFVAYLQLSSILGPGGEGLSPRSIVIATYGLSGFANFSSIAIQIGGISGIAPSRRHDLSRLGLRAMIGGTIAAFMTATVAGMLL